MERSPFVIVLLSIGAAVTLMLTLPNLSNVRVTAGYASYIYSRPIAGRSEFKQVIFGPASTGLSWRLDGQRVSITPYTYSEKFEAENAIIGKDKLPLASQAHIVWRLRPEAGAVQRFMEEFGGWESSADPDKIARESYDQFIREPFRTLTRSVVAQYNGLDVNESLSNISQQIETEVKSLLDKTPFEVMSVVMVAISAKVALNQTLEMKTIEEQIAEKSIAIERKNGEAVGARFAAQAREQAKAIEEIKSVLDPLYIEFLQAENIKGAERIYLPIGAGPQMVLPVKEGARGGRREEKPSAESLGAGTPNPPSPR
jgi:hypothetical protein